MAAPTIKIKRSSVSGKIPSSSNVPLGELAINTYDGYVYASKDVGAGVTVIAINPFRVGVGTDTYDTYFTQGNVGIGTINPTQKFDLNGSARFRGAVYDSLNTAGSNGQVLTSTGTGVTWSTVAAGSTNINATDTTDATTYYPVFVAATGSNQTARARSTATAFSFVPSTGTLTTVDFNATSDIKLKTNIRNLEDSLDKLLSLNGVTFNWIDTNRPSVGIIAQEVEEILPQLVSKTDIKSVNYNGLVALIIEAIKEQQDQINDLKKEIMLLKQ